VHIKSGASEKREKRDVCGPSEIVNYEKGMYNWWTRCVVTMSYVVLGHNVGNLDSENGVHGKALPKTSAEAITDTRTLVAYQRGNRLTNSTQVETGKSAVSSCTRLIALPAEEEFKKKIVGEAHSNGNDKPLRGLNTFG
jgi:hypothetical protein